MDTKYASCLPQVADFEIMACPRCRWGLWGSFHVSHTKVYRAAGVLYRTRDRYVQNIKREGEGALNVNMHTRSHAFLRIPSCFLISSRAEHFLQFPVSINYFKLPCNGIKAFLYIHIIIFSLLLHSYCSLSHHL